jgi:hypothetical protein
MEKMKKLITTIALISLLLQPAFAQTEQARKSVPLFNPENNCQLRYYYYPNLEAYFDTQKRVYYYKANAEWKTAEEIPNGYRGYSMFNKYNVMINDYDDDNITQFIDRHKKKYPYITNERSKRLTALTD